MSNSLLDELAAPDPAPPPRRRTKRVVIIGAAAVVVIGGVATAVVVSRHDPSPSKLRAVAPTTTAKGHATSNPFGCLTGDWPTIYSGQPASMASAAGPGFFVWNDAKGWHIRAVDKRASDKLAIKVTSAANLQAYSFKAVPAKTATVKVTGKTAMVSFTGSATPTGIDFALCNTDQVRFDLATGALPAPPDQIAVGKDSEAVANPVLVMRVS
jgi:hypothetical protein